MNADEHGIVASGYVSFDHGEMAFAAVHFALIGDSAEFSEGRGKHAFGYAEDVSLVLQAVADELGHGQHFEAVLGAEVGEIGDAGHGFRRR